MHDDRSARFSLGSRVQLEVLSRDPYPVLKALQEQEPVSWVPEAQAWFVTRVGPALVRHYGMSAEQVAFFTAHEEIGEQVIPIDTLLLARYQTLEDRHSITRAVRLSHEFELLFYETVLAATVSVT